MSVGLNKRVSADDETMRDTQLSDDAAEDLGSDFASNLIENVFITWIEPELLRRAMPVDRSSVWAAVVEHLPGGGQKITLNEEVQVTAKAKPTTGIERGTPLSAKNIDSLDRLIPMGVAPDNGWIIYVNVDGYGYLEFDLRYNKKRVGELLSLADDYISTVRASYETAPRPAIDNLFSAAELTVQAQMTSRTENTRVHGERSKWLAKNVNLGNVPADHKRILDRLKRERAAARYGDGSVTLSRAEVAEKIEAIAAMISFVRERTGGLMPRDSP
ncbi:hypothetical protein [Arthrobacter pigmenti]